MQPKGVDVHVFDQHVSKKPSQPKAFARSTTLHTRGHFVLWAAAPVVLGSTWWPHPRHEVSRTVVSLILWSKQLVKQQLGVEYDVGKPRIGNSVNDFIYVLKLEESTGDSGRMQGLALKVCLRIRWKFFILEAPIVWTYFAWRMPNHVWPASYLRRYWFCQQVGDIIRTRSRCSLCTKVDSMPWY